MTVENVEGWLWAARRKLVDSFALGAKWWPNTGRAGNKWVTPLAYLFFLEATAHRCLGRKLTLAAKARDGSAEREVLDRFWLRSSRVHSKHEVILDFSVHNWDAASP